MRERFAERQTNSRECNVDYIWGKSEVKHGQRPEARVQRPLKLSKPIPSSHLYIVYVRPQNTRTCQFCDFQQLQIALVFNNIHQFW